MKENTVFLIKLKTGNIFYERWGIIVDFDKNFETYNKNAVVQKQAAETLAKFLPENIKEYKNILELGCGTGFFTRELLKKTNSQNVVLNDFFDIRKYIKDIDYKKFLQGDMKNFLNEKYDCVVSSSCFQWSDNLEELLKLISLCSKNLIFSIYISGNMAEIKNHFGVSLKYYTQNEITEILKKYFKNVQAFEEITTLSFETPLEALKHIQKTGTSLNAQIPISKIKSYKETTLTYKTGFFRASNQ